MHSSKTGEWRSKRGEYHLQVDKCRPTYEGELEKGPEVKRADLDTERLMGKDVIEVRVSKISQGFTRHVEPEKDLYTRSLIYPTTYLLIDPLSFFIGSTFLMSLTDSRS
jgi:hypothetical protein